ncbi:MAG: radical SAM protein [Candidatus Sabulitectum sp.]|nr:radical SAM protein [Candidatus Sabulitectum sp.]
MAELIFVRVHAAPCVNKCWHCFCNGSPEGRFMDEEVVLNVLDSLAELKEKTGAKVFPLYYDEPTLHPGFMNIVKYQVEKGLVYDQSWFPTNGYGLARLSDKNWAALKDMGFDGIRLTFHGVGEDHDMLAGRKGAYNDLVKTVQKAEQFGIDWFAGMILNRENAASYENTKSEVEKIGTACSPFGWMLAQSQGRAKDTSRVKMQHIQHLLKGTSGWITEKQLIENIVASPDLQARKAHNHICGVVYLDIDEDLNVYYGGGCDGDPFHDYKNQVLLGNLNKESIHQCYEAYLNNPPRPVKLLSEISWGELAEKYGDPNNELVHHTTDLTGRKWSEAYLKDCDL